MPSTHQQASGSPDRRRYPEYLDRFGEDPSRFLNSGLDPHVRIRGLESVALCDAYLNVETDREQPRKEVVAHLNRRKAELEGETDG
jgi:hypothetical protein